MPSLGTLQIPNLTNNLHSTTFIHFTTHLYPPESLINITMEPEEPKPDPDTCKCGSPRPPNDNELEDIRQQFNRDRAGVYYAHLIWSEIDWSAFGTNFMCRDTSAQPTTYRPQIRVRPVIPLRRVPRPQNGEPPTENTRDDRSSDSTVKPPTVKPPKRQPQSENGPERDEDQDSDTTVKLKEKKPQSEKSREEEQRNSSESSRNTVSEYPDEPTVGFPDQPSVGYPNGSSAGCNCSVNLP
ncbi:hypothetical protein NM208_g15823 [Fusarium decemcellulare]|uniref:Uncharacterized protein n=1 Tax=Fusarium decemcellulare TaxID=57161 RepID=A0ACC1RFC3_9HYPO|nr:hypothetical protein NM208_g15823 [Fusarium decemcellulare]